MSQGFTSLLWLLAVLAAIPLVLWLLKRSPMLGGQAPPGAPRAVASLPIAPSQRVVTVEIGQGEDRTWLVLGVTPQQIRTLHTLPAPPDVSPSVINSPPTTTFSHLIARLRDHDGPGATRGGGKGPQA